MLPSTQKNIERLVDLIDREGHYPHQGHKWLKADQPSLAKRLGCSVRTLQTTIKDPAIETLRTRIDGKVVTLLRRSDSANSNSAIPQDPIPQSNSAIPQPKSAKPSGVTEEMQALKSVWIGSAMTNGDKPNYGLLRNMAGAGVTPDMLQTVIVNWPKFQTFCGIRVETRRPELKRICAVGWRVQEFCAAVREEHQKVIDELADAL